MSLYPSSSYPSTLSRRILPASYPAATTNPIAHRAQKRGGDSLSVIVRTQRRGLALLIRFTDWQLRAYFHASIASSSVIAGSSMCGMKS